VIILEKTYITIERLNVNILMMPMKEGLGDPNYDIITWCPHKYLAPTFSTKTWCHKTSFLRVVWSEGTSTCSDIKYLLDLGGYIIIFSSRVQTSFESKQKKSKFIGP